MAADDGMVRIQAVTISFATPQRTADTFFAAPTPMIEPVIVCVVDTGMPSSVAANNMIEPPVSAQQTCPGFRRVILLRMVPTRRQPPVKVPSAIAAWHAITTENGT